MRLPNGLQSHFLNREKDGWRVHERDPTPGREWFNQSVAGPFPTREAAAAAMKVIAQ